ncbi:ubiquitin thioesterase OTU1-like [Dysidea avara]|uniref:ubiquitin thioesterase OTU1-like n=1 Tax=Dysidea avara TaxID=196820 RepID=UPI003323BCEF
MENENLVLRVKTRSGRTAINGLTRTSTLRELQECIQQNTKIDLNRQKILYGYPPKELLLHDGSVSLAELGLRSGETLIVEEQSSPIASGGKITHRVTGKEKPSPKLVRKIVPADNSCLFKSISLLVTNASVTVQELRELVAGIIMSDPDKYSTAMLGRSNEQYTEWIMKDESWGGAIELSILSDSYETELHVVDVQTNRIDKFGQEKQYLTKALLIYDGIHYDPLVCQSDSDEVTMFSVDDEVIATQALNMAREAQQARQFTDTANFSLRCLACGKQLVGQKDAQAHAEQTQHTNFGEI